MNTIVFILLMLAFMIINGILIYIGIIYREKKPEITKWAHILSMMTMFALVILLLVMSGLQKRNSEKEETDAIPITETVENTNNVSLKQFKPI